MRSFGRPHRLDDWERIWLMCAGTFGTAATMVNGEKIAEIDLPNVAFGLEITHKLRDHNVVCFDVSNDSGGGGLDAVSLEIRSSAWFEDLELTAGYCDGSPELSVSGRVCGNEPEMLDVFVLQGRRTVFQSVVHACAEGTLCKWTIPIRDDVKSGEMIAVELVRGNAIWYREEVPMKNVADTAS